MTTIVAVVMMTMTGGGLTLPTAKSISSNDRPIIGILSQEIHGSLANDVVDLLASGKHTEFIGFNRERALLSNRFEYNADSLPDSMEFQGEETGYQDLEPQTSSQGREENSHTSHAILEGSEEDLIESSESATPVETRETIAKSSPLTVPPNATYIGASYVKFVEAAGARVVPIFVNRDRDYYEHIMRSINGILFPGGAVAIDESSAFGRAGKIIHEIAKEMNEAGDVFPLWGTCLGFELMMGLAANGQEIRAECDALNTANYLKLDPDYADGYLLRHLPKRLLKSITTEPLTSNFHHYCITPKNFTAFGVDKTYRALAYSADRRGVEYIAAAEAYNYPFFAVQFHPEKSPYEWTTKAGHDHIPHSSTAIDTANYFAQVFVNYARRNNHHFADDAEEAVSLIYNFSPIYTGQYSSLEQMYIF